MSAVSFSPTPPTERFRTVRLLGHTSIAAVTRERLECTVAADAARGEGGWIVTANLDHLRQAHASADVRGLVGKADIVVADGWPLVWASRLCRQPLPERVAGSDLIFTLSSRAAQHGLSIYLLGGAPDAAETAASRLTAANPTLMVAGTSCPPHGFERDDETLEAVVAHVVACAPRIVFVGVGFPKQDHLIVLLRERHPSAWYVGVGASIDFVAGTSRRAPKWMQSAGLEWVHRLAQEPRRLASRYLRHGIPFGMKLMSWSLRHRYKAPQA